MFTSISVNVSTSMDEDSDSYLVERCLKGDRNCFRQLYQRHEQKVRATLYQLCGISHLDDLVQEVFLRVWKGLKTWQKQSQFSTWLYRITWNVATDQRRIFAQQTRNINTLQQKSPNEPVVFTDLMQIHYQDLVQKGLEQLSLEHRAVLVLHDLEDVPQKEVANILNIPVGTVKSRLFYARDVIRKFLKQQGVEL